MRLLPSAKPVQSYRYLNRVGAELARPSDVAPDRRWFRQRGTCVADEGPAGRAGWLTIRPSRGCNRSSPWETTPQRRQGSHGRAGCRGWPLSAARVPASGTL